MSPLSIPPTPSKFVIKGSPGAGKTTFAAELARRRSLTHVELYGLHHGPNWEAPSPDVFRARVQAELDKTNGRWVIDGNYDAKLDGFVDGQADAIIWLDLPFHVKLRRLWRRTIDRIVTNAELWNGNRETWRGAFMSRDSLFIWFIRVHRRHRREWPSKFGDDPRVVRLHSSAEVAAWLDGVAGSEEMERRQIGVDDQTAVRISPR